MEKKRAFGKRDLILFAVIIAAGLIGMAVLYLRPAVTSGTVEVAVDGAVTMTLPLSEDTIQLLKEQRKKIGGSPWIFPSPNGGPISPDSVGNMLHRVLKRAGLSRIRFHDLRHTFATLALQNGVDIKTVSGMLGHYSAGFTLDTYAHVTTAAQKEAARAMGRVLANAL